MALRPSGVCKSTRGWELFRLLSTAGVNGAYVDADQLGLCYPIAPDDHFNHRLKAANLAAAWHGYRAAGAEYLIVSGFMASADEIRGYTDLAQISFCHPAPADDPTTTASKPQPSRPCGRTSAPPAPTTRLADRAAGS